MEMVLHALADDWNLNANGDTERGSVVLAQFGYYLTDPQGNRLTDPSGNYLVGYQSVSYYPQILHALPDDFNLNAE